MPMRIDVFTIFPAMLDAFFGESLLGKAQAKGVLDLRTHDLRAHTTDVHRSVDDVPFGGGAGMVLTPEPVFAAVEAVDPPRPLLLLSPGGRRFDQAMAHELAQRHDAGDDGGDGGGGGGFSLLCGRYEGVDQRVVDHLCDGEVSIGDYVLGGGEVAAMVIVEAVARLVPGVMGNADSATDESFSPGTGGLLEHPQYTRPATFRDWSVPEVLRSGDHAKVARWRLAAALDRTRRHRPDLLEARGGFTEAEVRVLEEFRYPGPFPAAPDEESDAP